MSSPIAPRKTRHIRQVEYHSMQVRIPVAKADGIGADAAAEIKHAPGICQSEIGHTMLAFQAAKGMSYHGGTRSF